MCSSDLKFFHVYYYREKFGLPPRRIRKSGISRYNVQPGEIPRPTLAVTIRELDKCYNPNHPAEMFARKARDARCYILLHHYTPLRKSEVYERLINDFAIIIDPVEGDRLVIDLFRKKKLVEKSSPFYVPIEAPHVDEIVGYLKERASDLGGKNGFIFPWGTLKDPGRKAWDIVKSVFPKAYPHYWRFKYITDGLSDPDTPVQDLRVEADLPLITLQKYSMMGSVQRAEALRRRRRRLKRQEAEAPRRVSITDDKDTKS